MNMQIKEFSRLAGVSVRTLHYYDEIGLLEPCRVDRQTGYRFYDESSLERMQEILFFRELDFPLKSILEILSSPNYDKQKALSEQKRLLILKKERLERLIAALEAEEKGDPMMDMKAFDNEPYETARKQYAEEARQRWGHTDAYRESQEKMASMSKENRREADAGINALMEAFARCDRDGVKPSEEAAQALVGKWKQYITDHYYTCTDEILAGLGEMYVSDQRFTDNIDVHGIGTARFMAEAIRIYCGK